MNKLPALGHCPVLISVNVDVEWLDAARAGAGGVFGRYSYGRYGVREGIPRLLKLFSASGVLATFFINPEDAKRHYQVVEEITGAGHEIAILGEVKENERNEDQLELLEKDAQAMSELTGQRPLGWRAVDGLLYEKTALQLAELGFLYDSSAQDDDEPYVMQDGALTLVELPVFDYLTDATFYANRHTDARVRKAWWEEAFALYQAGGYVNLTIHTRGDIGATRLPRIAMLESFINKVRKLPGTQFYRAADLAQAYQRSEVSKEKFPSFKKPTIGWPS